MLLWMLMLATGLRLATAECLERDADGNCIKQSAPTATPRSKTKAPPAAVAVKPACSSHGTPTIVPPSGTHLINMVRVELPTAGVTFCMGSPPSEAGRSTDETQHVVQLSRSYSIGTTEVTQAQWATVMRRNPSRFKRCGRDCPVDSVSWCDAVLFANALTAMEGGTPVYTLPSGFKVGMGGDQCNLLAAQVSAADTGGYRLPGEAEWEYAARSGQDLPYAGSETATDVGWVLDNAGSSPHPVRSKAPNAWGLYDMSGNVWEWVWDAYADYPQLSVGTPPVSATSTSHVIRGGAWDHDDDSSRVAARAWGPPGTTDSGMGFRLVK